jgi:hypothetical protein
VSGLKTIHHVRFSQFASDEIHGFVQACDGLFRVLCVAVLFASPALHRIARNRIETVRVARVKWLLLKSKALTNLNNLYGHRSDKSFHFRYLYTQNCVVLFCVYTSQFMLYKFLHIHKYVWCKFVYSSRAILMKGGALRSKPGPVDHDRPIGPNTP